LAKSALHPSREVFNDIIFPVPEFHDDEGNIGTSCHVYIMSRFVYQRITTSFIFLLLLILGVVFFLIGIFIMTVFIHMMARPVKGLGIAVPALLPPIMAAFFALMIAPQNAAMLAYISGTIGSLIGADLLNLKNIPSLGTPLASIGGAGTFDGIFLTGIISVLLA
jgi:uncharacterized membrane protein